jgi:hypothetical protein
MNKIDKLDKELEKAREKAAESGSWKSRNRRKKTARSCRRCAPSN